MSFKSFSSFFVVAPDLVLALVLVIVRLFVALIVIGFVLAIIAGLGCFLSFLCLLQLYYFSFVKKLH